MTDHHYDLIADAFGPQLMAIVEDPAVIEIWLNPDGKLFVETLKDGKHLSDLRIESSHAMNIITTIAGCDGKHVTEHSPLVDAKLSFNGARFAGGIPPVSEAPHFNLRMQASMVFTLSDLVNQGNITQEAADLIKQAILEKKNILIAGGTGSGKTTFANALLDVMGDMEDRVIILEDTPELKCPAEDILKLKVTPTVNMQKLVWAVLRRRGDRPVVGELRGEEAHDLLKLWNTGHPGGFATIHANSATEALDRIEDLAAESGKFVPPRMIVRAVHYVIFMEKELGRRRVSSFVAVTGHDGTNYTTEELLVVPSILKSASL